MAAFCPTPHMEQKPPLPTCASPPAPWGLASPPSHFSLHLWEERAGLQREVAGQSQGTAKSPKPGILFFTSHGNRWGQDWVTYELNQRLLLSPRAPAVPTQSCSLCLLPTGSTLYPPFPFVQFLFLFFLLLNDVVYGKNKKNKI